MTRIQAFLVFLAVVLTVYTLVNTYLYIRLREVLSPQWRIVGTILFVAFALSYIAARFLERFLPSSLSSVLLWIGSYWLGEMAKGVILLLCIDVIRFVFSYFPFLPRPTLKKEYVAIGVTMVLCVALVASRINALNPVVRSLTVQLEKRLSGGKCTIVAVSDLHLGTMVCNSHLDRIVEQINALYPDIVLFVGDILDEDLEPVIRNNFGETLTKLRSRYGVYGITGNHEYFGGVENAIRYLENHGVKMLRDTAISVDNGLVLVGREDVTSHRFTGRKRKSLRELLTDTTNTGPIVVLDHQPVALAEARSMEIDLQISGHTHHGQLFPFNFFASAVYEVSWGYQQQGKTHIYVSCGVGTWGPPLRSGNRPEIVHITLLGSEKE
ncbi:MAG: metallophosphoesterase [Bacteroidetes bacterium]|nr:metallophosphoesterase [Bacteroidota bacterium]